MSSNELDTLAFEINAAHAGVEAALGSAVDRAVECGRLLDTARARVPHGQWERWVCEHTALSPRTARAYRALARQLETADPAKRQRVAEMPLREALAELAQPSERRLSVTRDPAPAGVVIDMPSARRTIVSEAEPVAFRHITVRAEPVAVLPVPGCKMTVDPEPVSLSQFARETRSRRAHADVMRALVDIERNAPDALPGAVAEAILASGVDRYERALRFAVDVMAHLDTLRAADG